MPLNIDNELSTQGYSFVKIYIVIGHLNTHKDSYVKCRLLVNKYKVKSYKFIVVVVIILLFLKL